MKKIKTIIYGGAFNPPTIAHEDILKACIDYATQFSADIWIVPSSSRVDKQITTSYDMRIKLLKAMIKDVGDMYTSIDIIETELDRDGLISTFDTVKEFEALYINREFEWVFGSDSTQTMADWENGNWLLENLRMLAIKRPGADINLFAKNVKEIKVKKRDVSSTEIRRRIKSGESIDDLVGEAVGFILNKNTSPF